LLKSVDLGAVRLSQAAYSTQTSFEVKHIFVLYSGSLKSNRSYCLITLLSGYCRVSEIAL
jgi:hypothetical protein